MWRVRLHYAFNAIHIAIRRSDHRVHRNRLATRKQQYTNKSHSPNNTIHCRTHSGADLGGGVNILTDNARTIHQICIHEQTLLCGPVFLRRYKVVPSGACSGDMRWLHCQSILQVNQRCANRSPISATQQARKDRVLSRTRPSRNARFGLSVTCYDSIWSTAVVNSFSVAAITTLSHRGA